MSHKTIGVSNDERIWKRQIRILLGAAAKLAPHDLINTIATEFTTENNTSVIPRASNWKIRYAQLLSVKYPGHPEAERKMREIRSRIFSVVLRGLTLHPKTAIEVADPTILNVPTPTEVLALKMIENVRYIPVRIVMLGDAQIGRSTAITKFLRYFPVEGPIRDDHMSLLSPAQDRFSNKLFQTVERGNRPFQITIVEPPSDNIAAQIAALRGADSVIIGFACNSRDSILSVISKWVPFVRKWLGNSVPISVVGCKVDTITDAQSATEVFEILSSAGIHSFDLCLAPYIRCFCRAWTPFDAPMVDGTWL